MAADERVINMIRIRNNTDIYYIRGDDETIGFTATIPDGGEVTDYTGVFSVKKDYSDTSYILQVPLQNKSVSLTHDSTKNIEPGDYVWDIEIILANGRHQAIGPGEMHILPDVTTD